MSARQVLRLCDALLKDPDQGFVVTLAAVIAEDPPEGGIQLRAETTISRRRPEGQLKPTTTPTLSLNLRAAQTSAVQPPEQRNGRVELMVRYECVIADEEILEQQVAYAASALSRVFVNNLRAFSDASSTPVVIEIEDPIGFSWGQFDGPVSDGFLATINILERSSE